MTYVQDVARLAHALAGLTAAGPTPAGTLPAEEDQTALAARDAVVAELRGLSRSLLRLGPTGAGEDMHLVVASPAHALHTALADLSPAAEAAPPLLDVLASRGGPLTRAWQDAARAAVALESYHDLAAQLPDADAWAVARDVADLAAVLPHLDADLAAALPPDRPRQRQALLEPTAHGLLRVTARELQTQTAGLPAGTAEVHRPAPHRIPPVDTIGDLPRATRHLTALIAGRGSQLTAIETRAVARLLTDGVALTGRVLRATPPSTASDAPREAAQKLTAALPHLQDLRDANLATLTAPAPGVLYLAHQLRARMATVQRLVDHLDRTSACGTTGLQRLTDPLVKWATEAAGTAAALRDGLHAATGAGQLLTPRQDVDRGPDEQLLWLRVPPAAAAQQPVLIAATASGRELLAARPLLAGTATAPTAPDEGRAAIRQAALDTRAAFTALHRAAGTRSPDQLPAAVRAAHPSTVPHAPKRSGPAR